MTIRVTITTPDNKQARVAFNGGEEVVAPSTTRDINIHDGAPTVTVTEEAVEAEANKSGGGGHGVPGNGGG